MPSLKYGEGQSVNLEFYIQQKFFQNQGQNKGFFYT